MDSLNNASLKLGSDAWLELQAFKTRQLNRREKLNRHKTLHKDLINGIAGINSSQPFQHHASISTSSSSSTTTLAPSTSLASTSSHLAANKSRHTASTSQHTQSSTTTSRDHAKSSTSDQTTIVSGENDNKLTSSNSNAHNDSLDKTSVANTKAVGNNNLELVECLLLLKLFDVALKLPIDSRSLQRSICKIRGLETTSQSIIENLLQKFAHQELITVDEPLVINQNKQQQQQPPNYDDESCIYVTSADHTKLVEFDKSYGSLDNIKALLIESKGNEDTNDDLEFCVFGNYPSVPIQSVRTTLPKNDKCSTVDDAKQSLFNEFDRQVLGTNSQQAGNVKRKDDLESLLLLSSTKERESKKLGEELLELLSKPTAKERNLLESFRSADGYQVQEFCPKGTKGECRRNNRGSGSCEKLHFKKIIAKHTEESLGDCSFLNTCFHMDSCKYVHYEVDYDDTPPHHSNNNSHQHQFKRPHSMEYTVGQNKSKLRAPNDSQSSSDSLAIEQNNTNKHSAQNSISLPGPAGTVAKYTLSAEEQAIIDAKNRKRFKTVLYPPQWIQCDLRFFDMSLLGKFSVVMADPPWDIHMELPYGTMSDDEMRKLNIPTLQDDGVIFLWVTGRAMELGRECLALWGYERCDEIIWVKTNQLQRIIRTGRTGHWLNHGKEHCLVGVKGNPKDINRGLDCDVIVAEVRATSHKPDEIYGIIERLSPGTRKIELFGRAHNVQPNWITLGNQLNGVRLIEPSLVSAFKKIDLQTSADHLA